MKKLVLAAVAATALFIAAFSCAVVSAAPQEQGEKGEHFAISAEDRAALLDARIAALKVGLKLTPAQEKNWPALETTIREQAKARAARRAEWAEKRKEHEGHCDAIEALRGRSKALQEHAARVAALADAAKPLYESLDDGQKHRFGLLLRATAGHHRQHEARWGWGGRD